MNAAELQAKLDIDRETFEAWVTQGLPGKGKGARREFDADDVATWLIERGYAQPKRIVETEAAVAEHFEVTDRSVRNWRSEGMPWTDGAYDLDAIAEWRERRYGETAKAGDAEDRGHWETLKAKAAAEMAELKLAERRGVLIPFDEPKRVLVQTVYAIRTHLEQFPDRMYEMVELDTEGRAEVPRKARAAVEDLLRNIQATLRSAAADLEDTPESTDAA